MGIAIRRGTTKKFTLRISPLVKCVKETFDIIDDLPDDLDESATGDIYKVVSESEIDEYPENSYFEWNGHEWIYIGHDRKWSDFGTIHVRIAQGPLFIDKEFSDEDTDCLLVEYTQEETIRLNENKPAELQVFSVDGEVESEVALKTQIYKISILKSLWSEVLHNE